VGIEADVQLVTPACDFLGLNGLVNPRMDVLVGGDPKSGGMLRSELFDGQTLTGIQHIGSKKPGVGTDVHGFRESQDLVTVLGENMDLVRLSADVLEDPPLGTRRRTKHQILVLELLSIGTILDRDECRFADKGMSIHSASHREAGEGG